MRGKHYSQFFSKGPFRSVASMSIGVIVAIVLFLVLSLSPADAQATSIITQRNSQLTIQATSLLTGTVYLPFVVRNYDPTLPRLISPQDSSQLDTLIPLFVFDAGKQPPNTKGLLDYSTNPDPNRTSWMASFNLRSGANWKLLPSTNLQPNTTYYWRVGVIYDSDSSKTPRWTEQFSFTTAPAGGVILPAPTLVSPVRDSVVTPNDVVLQWAPVSDAVEYEILLHGIDQDWRYAFRSSSTQLEIADNIIALLGNHYEWFVKARNNYAWGTESERWKFDIATSGSSHTLKSRPQRFTVLKLDEDKEVTYPKW